MAHRKFGDTTMKKDILKFIAFNFEEFKCPKKVKMDDHIKKMGDNFSRKKPTKATFPIISFNTPDDIDN